MATNADIEKIDELLVLRLAALSRGGQRWLKTTLQSLTAGEGMAEPAEDVQPRPRASSKTEGQRKPATLEDVITGKADLREHLEAYPELADELDGLADVIDLLREAGAARRRRGEQILREDILGEKPEGEEEGAG